MRQGREPLSWHLCSLLKFWPPCCLRCGLWTRSTDITGELGRIAGIQAAPETGRIGICVLGSPGNSCVYTDSFIHKTSACLPLARSLPLNLLLPFLPLLPEFYNRKKLNLISHSYFSMGKFSTLPFPILFVLTEEHGHWKNYSSQPLIAEIEGWHFGSIRNFLASLRLKFFLWRSSVLRTELLQ